MNKRRCPKRCLFLFPAWSFFNVNRGWFVRKNNLPKMFTPMNFFKQKTAENHWIRAFAKNVSIFCKNHCNLFVGSLQCFLKMISMFFIDENQYGNSSRWIWKTTCVFRIYLPLYLFRKFIITWIHVRQEYNINLYLP